MTLNYWTKIFPDPKHDVAWSFSREYAKTPNMLPDIPLTNRTIEEPIFFYFADLDELRRPYINDIPDEQTFTNIDTLTNYNQSRTIGSDPFTFLFSRVPYVVVLESYVGFNFYDVSQLGFVDDISLLIMKGDIDINNVNSSLSDYGYTLREDDNINLWCARSDCISGRGEGNPHPQYIYYRSPIALIDNTFITTFTPEHMTEAIQTNQGTHPSYADVPEIIALGTALQEFGPIGKLNLVLPTASIESQCIIDERNVILNEILPPYAMAGVAQIFTDRHENVLLAYAYHTRLEAEAALEAVPLRLSSYENVPYQQYGLNEHMDQQVGIVSEIESNDGLTLYIAIVHYKRDLVPASELYIGIREPGRTVYEYLVEARGLWFHSSWESANTSDILRPFVQNSASRTRCY